MVQSIPRDPWTEQIVADPDKRAREYRRAVVLEASSAIVATAFVITAIWQFLRDPAVPAPLPPAVGGGIATICFIAFFSFAQGAAIRRRILTLVAALENQRREAAAGS